MSEHSQNLVGTPNSATDLVTERAAAEAPDATLKTHPHYSEPRWSGARQLCRVAPRRLAP